MRSEEGTSRIVILKIIGSVSWVEVCFAGSACEIQAYFTFPEKKDEKILKPIWDDTEENRVAEDTGISRVLV